MHTVGRAVEDILTEMFSPPCGELPRVLGHLLPTGLTCTRWATYWWLGNTEPTTEIVQVHAGEAKLALKIVSMVLHGHLCASGIDFVILAACHRDTGPIEHDLLATTR